MSSLTDEQLKALEDVKLIEKLAKDEKLVLFNHIKENKSDFKELVDKLELTDEKVEEIRLELEKSFETKVEEVKQAIEDIELLEPEKGEKGDKGDKGDNGNDGYTPIKGIDYFDGEDGKDADENLIIEKVIEQIPIPEDGKDGSPDIPDEIKSKLESLKGKDRLDASAIKNLPVNEIRNITKMGYSGLQDILDNGAKVTNSIKTLDFTGFNLTKVNDKKVIVDIDEVLSGYLKLDQTTPQTLINGIPLLEATRTIDSDYQLVDKKYVDDAVEVENLWDRTGTTLSPHTAGDDIETTGELTASKLNLGTGEVIKAGSFDTDTTMTFKSNLNSGDNAFRIQFVEQYLSSVDRYASGGYIQYNSNGNYLEFGGIENNDPYPDVPGFRIARDTGKATYVADAQFDGNITGNVNFTGNADFNDGDVNIDGDITGTPRFLGDVIFAANAEFQDYVYLNFVNSHTLVDFTNPAYLKIKGPSNGLDCATIDLLEGSSDSYGMYLKYDGAGNYGYIGMNNNGVKTDFIKLNRSGSNVRIPTGNLAFGDFAPTYTIDIARTDNRIRLGYSSLIYTDFLTTSLGELRIAPTNGDTFFNTGSELNRILVYDNSSATTDYCRYTGEGFTLINDGDTKMDFSYNGSYIKTDAGFNRALKLGPNNTTVDDGAYIEFTSSATDGYGAQIGGIREDGLAGNALVFRTGKNAQAERMRISDNGNVGIGTTPAYKLDIAGAVNTDTYFRNVGTGNRLYLGYDNATKGYTYADASGNWHHKPSTGWNYYDTTGVNNFVFIYDYTQPSSSYTAMGGNYWGITYQTSLNVKIKGNGTSWLNGGNVGIGTNSPTALLHLGAGTTTNPALKFTAGTLLTTPETGSIEFANDRFYITNVETARPIDRTSDVETSTQTVTNTTTETTVFTGIVSGNDIKVGNILKLYVDGSITSASAADTLTLKVKFGGVTFAQVTTAGSGALSDDCWHASGVVTARSVGATGSLAWHFDLDVSDNSDESCGIDTLDTTTANNVTVTAQWNNAKAGNIFNLNQGFLEFKN